MKRLCLIGALACVLAVAPVSASTFLAVSQGELVKGSSAVVVGDVLYTYSYWNREGTMIFTDAVIHVRESILGAASGLVAVRTPGGTVADYRVEAHGFPAFRAGDRQVLFLNRTADGLMEVTGFQQGQYKVVHRSDGVAVAVPALRGVRLLTASGAPAPMPRAIELDALAQSIRSEARGLDRQPVVK
jgi:hypothetical protein